MPTQIGHIELHSLNQSGTYSQRQRGIYNQRKLQIDAFAIRRQASLQVQDFQFVDMQPAQNP